MKSWRLTRRAETSLTEIARWTTATFGAAQADAYAENLIATCHAIATGTAQAQACYRLIDPNLSEDLHFARSGAHLVVFTEAEDQVIITDFLHSRSDLARRIANLPGFPTGNPD